MAARYSDEEIDRLLKELKPLPDGYLDRIKLRERRGHRGAELDVDGAQGSQFRIIVRQLVQNPLDFSVILGVFPPGSNQVFRLRRYNGAHEHTNHIEHERIRGCHIHLATARYQELGTREDAYAVPTDRFSDIHGALRCLLADCGCRLPKSPQRDLFDEVQP